MSIIDLLDSDRRSREQYIDSKDAAWDLFQQERDALKTIAKTQGFVVIRNYRAREKEICESRLATMTKAEISAVQSELKLATRFLQYLDNMLLDIGI